MNVSTKVERRVVDSAELRVDTQENDPVIRGHAAVFDAMSQPLMGFQEIVRKGAFKKTIRESDIRALWNHDPNFVLGRKSARTLRLEEDEKGLATRIFPPSTTWAQDLMESISRGDVSQMSFGFRTVKDRWSQPDANGVVVRELLEVQLFDVSPVTFPAYTQTEVHVRTIMGAVMTRLESGELGKEERAAMVLALDNMRTALLEPGEPHSGGNDPTPEPGQPHSMVQRRTLTDLRLRHLQIMQALR